MTDDWGPRYSDYYWIRVRDLPVPHNPFRLPEPLARDWASMGRGWPSNRRQVLSRRGRDRWVRKQRLRPGLAELWDIAAIDWHEVVDLVKRMWERGEYAWERGEFDDLLDGASGEIALAARNLCFLPITWSPGDESFTDGQHRSLVLAVQGIDRVLVCGT